MSFPAVGCQHKTHLQGNEGVEGNTWMHSKKIKNSQAHQGSQLHSLDTFANRVFMLSTSLHGTYLQVWQFAHTLLSLENEIGS